MTGPSSEFRLQMAIAGFDVDEIMEHDRQVKAAPDGVCAHVDPCDQPRFGRWGWCADHVPLVYTNMQDWFTRTLPALGYDDNDQAKILATMEPLPPRA